MVRQIAPAFFTMDILANPDKYADELLDAYLAVEDAHALYAERASDSLRGSPTVVRRPRR